MEPLWPATAPPADQPATSFQNDPLDVATLPHLDGQPFTSLERGYLRMRLLIGTAVGLVALACALAFSFLGPDGLPTWGRGVAIGVALCLLAVPFIAEPISFAHRGWLMREHDISVRSGVISRRVTTAPFTRVQHASVHEGALERAMGLASLKVFTAGNQFADLTIEGLTKGEAHRLKEVVVSRTRTAADG